MDPRQVIGPGRDPFETKEYWICLVCGEESASSYFLQCQNGIKINETLKRALAAICCSESLITQLIKKTKASQEEASIQGKSEIGKRFDITKDLELFPIKKHLDVFFDKSDFMTAVQLRVMAKKDKQHQEIRDDYIITLLKIFKPLLTNSEVTLFHKGTRICEECCHKIRKEKYEGGDKVPEILCPICFDVLK